ncbi:4-amino-4-deoxy-L-arabinose-phosphoundecaprenol flippase subunit ArnF [Erwinia sp. V71]|uniref:4-amino-4-deoxy-L-arabinose-phosphoundecaprenol flippase subunit ArnF n=1 Tax=Erwinia sp. V71 TaxID=3369424 RepID=UPI003F61E5DD
MTGYLWAALSIVLVSVAQLSMRWAMVQLPAVSDITLLWQAMRALTPGALALGAGLAAYVLSTLCWVMALHRIRLSRAYPLLSLSYILVWGAALWLPGLQERFSWEALGGVTLIFIGIVLISWPSSR